ncbi:long-chain-fatty-acid--CoA ligase [Williamsia sp. 1138]|uniref:long-chain-fatty-acid--CoA ligase n=1 Tax=Williamsia sp. 1138 TaxID=1903117 RepID=UPI000A105E44|nr:long-chain-fatty-acid--CoA ligase [Williamsia sp. 1138]
MNQLSPSGGQLLITDFLFRARDMFGHKEIISYDEGVEVHRYDYATYVDRVIRLAGALVELGIKPGDRVATLAWNHHRHLELYMAIPLAGAVLHTVNLRLEPDEIAYIVDHAEDTMIVADASLLPLLDVARSRRPDMTVVLTDETDSDSGLLDYEALLQNATPLIEIPPRDENDLAALCYTSGTTGDPKGVGYTHRALYLHTFAACLADGHAISERDRVCHVVPMFHANAWGIPFAALMSGAEQILPGPHPTPSQIATIIADESVTYTGMVPTVAVDLLDHSVATGTDLSSLRALVLGGSTPSVRLIADLEDKLGVRVFQGWGMTEISPMATFSRPPAAADTDPSLRHDYVRKQGRLLPGLHWKLVDADGTEVPRDGKYQGEVLMRGPWVATTYYNESHPDKFVDGWLRTGDIGIIDEQGFLEIVDRAKDLIKSGGEWISSVALEQALLQNPAVADAAVIAVKHPRWQERPVAFVVFHHGKNPSAHSVLDELAERVPRWWLPEQIVPTDALPRTSVGKVDKKSLRSSASEQVDLWDPTTATADAVPSGGGSS